MRGDAELAQARISRQDNVDRRRQVRARRCCSRRWATDAALIASRVTASAKAASRAPTPT
jgi:hypothetical protein